MHGQHGRPDCGHGGDVRAGERAQEPGNTSEGEQDADPALRPAGPRRQPAHHQRKPGYQITASRQQALSRQGEPLRRQAKQESGRPQRPHGAPGGTAAQLRKPAHSERSPTAHPWR